MIKKGSTSRKCVHTCTQRSSGGGSGQLSPRSPSVTELVRPRGIWQCTSNSPFSHPLTSPKLKKALKLPSHRYLPTPTKFYFLPPPYSVPPPSSKRPEGKIILISCFGKCQSYWFLVPLFVSRCPLECCLPSIKKVKADVRLCRSSKRCWSSLHIQGKAP